MALVALALFGGPRLVDGLSALEWTRYHARRGLDVLTAGDAPRAGRSAAAAVDRLAPLHFAREAARLGLELGKALEAESPEAALAVYTPIREALDQARSSPLRSWGLGELADEARRLEAEARRAVGEPST